MKYKLHILASILAALLMALPLAAVMKYAETANEPRRTELTEKGVKADLELFRKEHGLRDSEIVMMLAHKGMPFINSWLSYAGSIGLTVGGFLLIKALLEWLITKRERPNQAPLGTARGLADRGR